MRSNFPVGFGKGPDRGVDHCSYTQELFLSFFPDQGGHSRQQLLPVGLLYAVLKIQKMIFSQYYEHRLYVLRLVAMSMIGIQNLPGEGSQPKKTDSGLQLCSLSVYEVFTLDLKDR